LLPSSSTATGNSGIIPLLLRFVRFRFALPVVAIASWVTVFCILALSQWNPDLSFMTIIAVGTSVFVWSLGLFVWVECRHAPGEVEPDILPDRAEPHSQEKRWFYKGFLAGCAIGAIIAPAVFLRIALG